MTRTTPDLTPCSLDFRAYQLEDVWPPAYDLACRPTYTADLRWNRLSNLEPSGVEGESLPLGHRSRPIEVCCKVATSSLSWQANIKENQTCCKSTCYLGNLSEAPEHCFAGNQFISQYLSVHKNSFSDPPTNRCLEEAVVGD
ncbi:hypothetical protein AVEN_159450-1 [Araneus ventricosus]|uniref:Uncharacterized protein n=1 Tax=Araneus ventricosus TaxID=182803 RepID=A0A4Y2A2F6_ARAVE|nr:hypothetical protein AVEN_159450-1 [Araneus ventricosus]